MKNSSQSISATRQGDWAPKNYSEQIRSGSPPAEAPGTLFPRLELGTAYAETARLAGRMNAAHISQEEHDVLLAEREKLLQRKFDGALTRREFNRLEYVRWSLDRIEDARYGHTLDALDSAVSRYEQFLGEIRDLKSQLEAATRRKK